MDNNRPEISYGRSMFHNTHVMNANAIYELPFGAGPQMAQSVADFLNVLVGGWQIGTIVNLAERFAGHDLLGSRHVQPRRPLELRHAGKLQHRLPALLGRRDPETHRRLQAADGKIYWIDPEGDRHGDRPGGRPR